MKKLMTLFMCLVLSFQLFANNTSYDTMVVFGDSLSDNGNLYRYSLGYLPASPPYYKGRFSNGPLWVEYLSQDLNGDQQPKLLDYAVGGAGAVLARKAKFPFSLTMEVDDYLYWNKSNKQTSSLFTLWIGANNYLDGPQDVDNITDSVVDSIEYAIEKLIAVKGDKFLIANLPDLGNSPYAAENHNEALLTELTQVHNRKLLDKINRLQKKYPEVTFVYFDADTYLNYVKTHAADFGFSNIKDPCYMGGYRGLMKSLRADDESLLNHMRKEYSKLSEAEVQMIIHSPELREAAEVQYLYQMTGKDLNSTAEECKGYLFWDHIHPTAYSHRLISEEIQRLLKQSGLQVGSA